MFRAVNYLESAYKVFFMEREYEIFALRILKKKSIYIWVLQNKVF